MAGSPFVGAIGPHVLLECPAPSVRRRSAEPVSPILTIRSIRPLFGMHTGLASAETGAFGPAADMGRRCFTAMHNTSLTKRVRLLD